MKDKSELLFDDDFIRNSRRELEDRVEKYREYIRVLREAEKFRECGYMTGSIVTDKKGDVFKVTFLDGYSFVGSKKTKKGEWSLNRQYVRGVVIIDNSEVDFEGMNPKLQEIKEELGI